MTKTQAHEILDGLKNGIQAPQYQINIALLVTGDLGVSPRNRGQGMDQEIPGQSQRGWSERCPDMVGQNH